MVSEPRCFVTFQMFLMLFFNLVFDDLNFKNLENTDFKR